MQPERKTLQKWCCPLVMPVAKRSEQFGFSLRDPRIEILDGLPTDLCMDQSVSFYASASAGMPASMAAMVTVSALLRSKNGGTGAREQTKIGC
jgi:hypothetical protein